MEIPVIMNKTAVKAAGNRPGHSGILDSLRLGIMAPALPFISHHHPHKREHLVRLFIIFKINRKRGDELFVFLRKRIQGLQTVVLHVCGISAGHVGGNEFKTVVLCKKQKRIIISPVIVPQARLFLKFI